MAPRPPPPPNRFEPVSVPIFALSWFVSRFAPPVEDADQRVPSIVAYCGGGGSARTGIPNAVFVDCRAERSGRRQSLVIPTGTDIGVALATHQNVATKRVFLLVCVKNEVRRYHLPSGAPAGALDLGEEVSAVAVHPTEPFVAVGCESGHLLVYRVAEDLEDDETFEPQELVFRTDVHTKAVCCLAFSEDGNRLISSAKDGCACIFEGDRLVSGLKCSVLAENEPPPQRAAQVIVKGCAFLDPHGRTAVTVASPRRGKSYIARWHQTSEEAAFGCVDRVVCAQHPISSFSLSLDGILLALGASDGTVVLWDVPEWKASKTFREVHDFPVTCIAARPFTMATLLGEEDGVTVEVMTASADMKMGLLTRQRRAKGKSQGLGVMTILNGIIYAIFLSWLLSPLYAEYLHKCGNVSGLTQRRHCLMEQVLLAPESRPGVAVPPY